EQFLILKEKLDREGLFDPQRKRPLTAMPRAIGVVTSLGAAALHDVVTALQRRVPHIPVVLAPASVQGEGAPRELVKALESLFTLARDEGSRSPVDTILLVRGGGSMEDLWAFNDEALARVIARSPVPVVCGVGHETDFTIADFVADLRAPTPTAAAELVAMPTQVWLDEVQRLDERLQEALTRRTDREAQRLDQVTARMGRPSQLAHRSRMHLASLEQGLSHAMQIRLRTCRSTLESMGGAVPRTMQRTLEIEREQLARAALRLGALDPSLVLRRGYAWLADGKNRPITSITQTQVGQQVVATLADGAVDMTVQHRHAN
ncbi:MAG TPA: exodeoxyribonuclease VII large subunit, partial [Rhodoferax sp.]|nr:exodeoxyribonuclease VII large subunit [Rhodoferax sp.]